MVVDDINEILGRGLDIRLLTLRPEKDGLSLGQECGISEVNWAHIYFSGLFDLSAWIKIIRLLKKWKPRAVVTHLWFANTIGRIAARMAGVPIIVSFEHNIYDNIKSRRQFLADRMFARLSRHIIAVSDAVRDSLVEHGIFPEKIIVLRNGIKLERYRNISRKKAREKLGIQNGEFIFLFIGRLTRQKGADILIQALAGLKEGRIFIVGDGEERGRLEKLAEDLGMAPRISFLGSRSDVPEILAASDCFILPSRWEGLGIVVMEAMTSGLPVIASGVDGIKEIVADGETGILVKPGDIQALGRAIQSMAKDLPLRRKLSENSIRRSSEFSIERHVDKLLEITG